MLARFLEFLAQFFEKPPVQTVTPVVSTVAVAAVETAAPAQPSIDVAQFQGLVGRVSELTTSVAQDVGQHNKSIQAISSELTTVAQTDPSSVAAIVCKLLVANQELQGRLERAEATLQTHSRQLHDAVTTARTDALTGLLNRRALDEELATCLSDFKQCGQKSTLMILDVDRFKQFNDTYGHLIGDKGLVHVAGSLRSQAKSMDLVARFGGEEFVIVFCGQSAADIRQRADEMRRKISHRPMSIDGCEKIITASGGLSEIATGDTVADWLKRADSALYAAKNDGRDCAFEMHGKTLEKIAPTEEQISPEPSIECLTQRTIIESAAELAAEAFADTSFVPSIARRIAEWRRGGTTLTVVLAQLDNSAALAEGGENTLQAPMRKAMSAARASVREMDLVTRWQSNGVAMLLPSTSAADTKAVVRRLKSLMSTESSDQQTQISLSIGIAEGIEGNDAKRVLERAWLALETARCSGPGGVTIHDGVKTVALKLAPAVR
jgi:diguanylate cyclase (GGDEF)-like protein